MAKVRIQAGAELDVLNKGELDAGMAGANDAWFRERAAGLKYMRLPVLAATPSGGVVQLGGIGGYGPASGFIWAIQRLSVSGLATADVLNVFRNTVDPQNFIGQLGAGAAATFTAGSKGFILLPDETLVISGSSLTATVPIIVNGEAVEVPSTQVWKVL